jgi:hypothetical protein
MTIEDARTHLMERLLSLPSLIILFVFSFLLSAEEAFHLIRSHPNSIEYYGKYSVDHHSACIPRSADNVVLQCPTQGYGSMIFICNHFGCGVKEPSTGLVVDPMEAQRIRGD